MMTLRRWLACWFLCGLTSAYCVADPPAGPLKVVTYNIRFANPGDGLDIWANRIDAVAEFIAQNDVIGLQEVTFPQLRDLQDRLKDFDHFGVGRDDGKQGGEHAVIFYRRSRLSAVEKGTIWLSETPDRVGSKGWDAALPRTCTWMKLRDTASRGMFWIANTHFDHRGAQARIQSGKLVHQLAAESGAGLPKIVLGDFNCLLASQPYDEIIGEGSLADARYVSQSPPDGPMTTWNGFRELVPDRIIDHIFVGGPIEVMSLEVLNPKTASDRFASDHLPVRARIVLKDSSPRDGVRGQ